VLTLYLGCHPVVRTVSGEMLLQSFLSELRARALDSATDRVYLKSPAVLVHGAGVLLPPSAARRLVRLERAAERSDAKLYAVAALVVDLKNGLPVQEFVAAGDDRNGSLIESIDAIAVAPTESGQLPTRAEVLFDLAQRAPNLHSVGEEGLEALASLVERAELIPWNEARPHDLLKQLAGTLRPIQQVV